MSNRPVHFADLEMLYVCRQVALDIFCPKMGSWRPFWPAFVRGTCRCDYFFFGLRVDWQQFGKFGGRTGPRSFCVASVRQAIILNLGVTEGLYGVVRGRKDCPGHCNEGSVIKLFVLKLASLRKNPLYTAAKKGTIWPHRVISLFFRLYVGWGVGRGGEVGGMFVGFLNGQDRFEQYW